MLLLTAVIARKFNSKTCETLGSIAEWDEGLPPKDPSVDDRETRPAKKLVMDYRILAKAHTPEAEELRKTYEEILIIYKNHVVKEYKFVDPIIHARRQAEAALNQAALEAEAAQRQLDQLLMQKSELQTSKDRQKQTKEALAAAHAALAALGGKQSEMPKGQSPATPDVGVFPTSSGPKATDTAQSK